MEATQSSLPQVLNAVKSLKLLHPNAKVKVTGHSLGAAISQLTGMALIKEGFEVSTINFGQPRVGNEAYAEFADTKFESIYRVVHNRDIVPHLPPKENLLLGYHHSRYELYQDENGKIKKCDASGEDPKCANQFYEYNV